MAEVTIRRIAVRMLELRRIFYVEGLSPKLRPKPLSKVQRLEYRHVARRKPRTEHSIASNITLRPDRCSHDTRRIEPLTRDAVRQQDRTSRRRTRAVICTELRRQNRDRSSRLCLHNRIQLPSSGRKFQPSAPVVAKLLSMPKRKIVQSTRDKDMPLIQQ